MGTTATVSSTSKALEFYNLQSPEFRSAYELYQSLITSSPAPSQKELVSALTSHIASTYTIPEKPAAKIAALLIKSFSSPTFTQNFVDMPTVFPTLLSPSTTDIDPDHAFILQSDADAFKSLVSADPHSSFELRALLMSFLIAYRRNWHPKGWVHYDRRAILYMAGLSTASTKVKEDLTTYLHTEYGLEMQVIGSNSPIPCFMFAWTKDHPESPSNPRLDLGPYAPSSTFLAVTRFGGAIPDDIDSPID